MASAMHASMGIYRPSGKTLIHFIFQIYMNQFINQSYTKLLEGWKQLQITII